MKEQGDVEVPDLWKRLGVSEPHDEPLGFEPTSTRYFDDIARELKLTADERALFRRQGFVSVDHRQRYGMGSAYYAIYTRDLPVLVTTDSILHAWHRSFDTVLKELEAAYFVPALQGALATASEAAAKRAEVVTDPALRESLKDVDLYFTVARNLLEGGGTSTSRAAPLAIPPWLAEPHDVEELLAKIAALKLEREGIDPPTKIYGGQRYVDWSQFRPRGHYEGNTLLERYFRCSMWLGRADLGWNLALPVSHVDPKRERRAALLAVMLLDQTNAGARLGAVSRVVDFLVGRPDNVSVADIHDALAEGGLGRVEDVVDPQALARFDAALAKRGARAQQIRSQFVASSSAGTQPTALPLVFQVFGQRFALDSFVLANVVFDQIVYRNEKQLRMLPSGLDVMAALGNETALRLLKPELERYHYASNLLAARRSVDGVSPAAWNATTYDQWLAALRALDEQPGAGAFPRAMRREAWRDKELRTALAAWTELRHDTILYVKQSYTASPLCEYPTGYVEPYPAFFARMAELAKDLADRLDPGVLADRPAQFFRRFVEQMLKLERLAQKELRQEPFDAGERGFLKRTLDVRGGGSGGPHYTGWYPELFYGSGAGSVEPVIADVHTNPDGDTVLEEGTGDVQFLIVAIDNGPHRATYVGPAYSYYEFTSPASKRLTDREWAERIHNATLPEPPAFTRSFQAPPLERVLDARVRPAGPAPH